MLFARAVPLFYQAQGACQAYYREETSRPNVICSRRFFALSQCFINSDIFFDARRLVSSLAHCQRRRSKSSDTFLRVSLRLDKPSEDRLVLTKVEKNIFMLAARVRRLRYLGGTSMKSQEWRQQLGDCVRALFLSPEMEHFYSIKMTLER